jgi:hypothetical protein
MFRGQPGKPLSDNFADASWDKPHGECDAAKDGEVAKPPAPFGFLVQSVKLGK